MAKGTTGPSSENELHERLDRIEEEVRELIPVVEAAADGDYDRARALFSECG